MGLDSIIGSIVDFLQDAWTYVTTNTDAIAFVVLAAIAIIAAIYVVTSKEIMHSAFYLALVFLCVGVTYFFLEAELLGLIQIIVYVGAITILFAFSIMLTRRKIMNEEEGGEE